MGLIKHFSNGGPLISYRRNITPSISSGTTQSKNNKKKSSQVDVDAMYGDLYYITEMDMNANAISRKIWNEHDGDPIAYASDPRMIELNQVMGIPHERNKHNAKRNLQFGDAYRTKLSDQEVNPSAISMDVNAFGDFVPKDANSMMSRQEHYIHTEENPNIDNQGNIRIVQYDDTPFSKDKFYSRLARRFQESQGIYEEGDTRGVMYTDKDGNPTGDLIIKTERDLNMLKAYNFWYERSYMRGNNAFQMRNKADQLYSDGMSVEDKRYISETFWNKIKTGNIGYITIGFDEKGNPKKDNTEIDYKSLINEDGTWNNKAIHDEMVKFSESLIRGEAERQIKKKDVTGVIPRKLGEADIDASGKIINEQVDKQFWQKYLKGEIRFPEITQNTFYTVGSDGAIRGKDFQLSQINRNQLGPKFHQTIDRQYMPGQTRISDFGVKNMYFGNLNQPIPEEMMNLRIGSVEQVREMIKPPGEGGRNWSQKEIEKIDKDYDRIMKIEDAKEREAELSKWNKTYTEVYFGVDVYIEDLDQLGNVDFIGTDLVDYTESVVDPDSGQPKKGKTQKIYKISEVDDNYLGGKGTNPFGSADDEQDYRFLKEIQAGTAGVWRTNASDDQKAASLNQESLSVSADMTRVSTDKIKVVRIYLKADDDAMMNLDEWRKEGGTTDIGSARRYYEHITHPGSKTSVTEMYNKMVGTVSFEQTNQNKNK